MASSQSHEWAESDGDDEHVLDDLGISREEYQHSKRLEQQYANSSHSSQEWKTKLSNR